MPDDTWWTKQQACRHLGISARQFEYYVADGMPVVKIGRQVHVRRTIIQAEYRTRRLRQKGTRATP
ncbi:hypothetical protein DEI99_005210 [Curtobacterium sp. MCLR17_036]|uniref:hypothetical protein n=1 Tax=Curtobacterium sp. MCLR17_036 TaxID=2175620 RepID=UPI000DA97B08|nr:hypothetical protein [Curtobacterium sp. MCLR17_036]WIE65938.1 hypothetical protein DEI99_005210 [Curtobacterium sp. MCLR17_036]